MASSTHPAYYSLWSTPHQGRCVEVVNIIFLWKANKRLWHCRCLWFSFILNRQQTFVHAFVTQNLFVPTQHQEAAWNLHVPAASYGCTLLPLSSAEKRPHKASTHTCPRIQRRQRSLGPAAITWWPERSGQLPDIKPTWRREEILLPSASRDLCRAQIWTPPLTFHNRKEVDGWDTSPHWGCWDGKLAADGQSWPAI